MPIRINLLAEALAQEELRRRDPVKRAIWVSAFLVLAVVGGCLYLQGQAMVAKAELSRIEAQLSARAKEYNATVANQRKLADMNHKLDSLQQLAGNRLLYGTLLNALQQTPVDDVQLMRFRVEQAYVQNEEIKPKTNADNRITPGKPATTTERILVTLDARDSAPNPGDRVNQFKQRILEIPYFQDVLGKTNEIRLAKPEPPTSVGDSKPFRLFTLECRYPEKTR
jgi:hypothetical protein